LWHGRWWAASPACQVTTTHLVDWELRATVVEVLLVVDVADPLEPEPKPMNAKSERRMSRKAT
jgi:hypothetical protein